MASDLTGGCACGAIRYQVTGSPRFSIICQCRQCQHISGSGHAAQFAVAKAETTINGEIKFYRQLADTGNTVGSGFCNNCGSPVAKQTTKLAKLWFFHAATLDDPARYVPETVVFESSSQPWDHVDPSLPRN